MENMLPDGCRSHSAVIFSLASVKINARGIMGVGLRPGWNNSDQRSKESNSGQMEIL